MVIEHEDAKERLLFKKEKEERKKKEKKSEDQFREYLLYPL